MNVNVRKAQVADTPASTMMNYVSDKIAGLMAVAGVKSLSVSKFVSGFGSAVNTDMEFFDGIPRETKTLGYVWKDALGSLMCGANMLGLSISMDDSEMKRMRKSWADSASVGAAPASAVAVDVPEKEAKPKKKSSKKKAE